MKITSSEFKDNGMIPKKYTCESEDISPPLNISDPPFGTKSFAIMMVDPDAPSDHDFVHWLIWNIDSEIKEIMEGTVPVGAVEGTNDFDEVGYGGPCPPSGEHRYEFHFYALDTVLDLPTTSEKGDLRNAMIGHILEETFITGLYEKI